MPFCFKSPLMPNKVSPTAASTWVAISVVSRPPVSPGLLQILQNSREDSNGSVWHFKNRSQLQAEWPALYKGYRSRIRIRIRIFFSDVPIQDWDLRSITVFPLSLFLCSMIETTLTGTLSISSPDVWRSLLSCSEILAGLLLKQHVLVWKLLPDAYTLLIDDPAAVFIIPVRTWPVLAGLGKSIQLVPSTIYR